MSVFINISEGKDVDIQELKSKDQVKYSELLKEHELLKEKLDVMTKELFHEKEKKKTLPIAKVDDKNPDLQNSE